MPEQTAKWVEVFSLGEVRAGVLDLPRKAWPKPGQYLPVQSLMPPLWHPPKPSIQCEYKPKPIGPGTTAGELAAR